MFSSFTSSSSALHVPLAVLSSLAVANALCLPCQVGLQAPLTTPSWPHSRRGVYSPPIVKPDSSTKWARGAEVDVTWSTSNAPASITNRNGTILLGHLEPGSPGEHLDLDNPLATGFDILDGHHTVTVPNVPSGTNYIIVLMGDSGNRSPEFTIE
ncbi:hypothetical protein DFH07DRAFT_728634 [Mycena maculata]|uniref:Uncharacterized protein n=1 Tax=Mycena maculata TaxID=230809 RepID=A0AAD7NZT0_9AGAR|nr:hypothetical protein DFH07DRAFT_728634 [Mycena maculata]